MLKDNISAAVKYIEAHPMEPVSIEKLAGLTGYSVDYFAHYFRKSTGLSVAAFVRRQRLALAALSHRY